MNLIDTNQLFLLREEGVLVVDAKDTAAKAESAIEEVKHEAGHGKEEKNPLNPSPQMTLWTWVTFGIVLAILYKVAWKPILAGLDVRESTIKKSLEDAEKAKEELATVQEKTKQMLHDAEVEAKNIVSKARETAQTLGKEIEEKAKSEAQTVRDNALKDIESAKVEAMQTLRAESSELAISLAGKLLGENLDNEKNRALTEKLISKI